MPALGAPLTYVTTQSFLSVFGLGSLRDLPDSEALEEAGLLERRASVEPQPDDLDDVLGLGRGTRTATRRRWRQAAWTNEPDA
jgi:segregation and condensation protein B